MGDSLSPRGASHWVAIWTATPQLKEEDNMPPEPYTLRVSTGAQYIRLRISNAFGLDDLPVTAMTIALPKVESGEFLAGTKAVLSDTIWTLGFGGQQSIDIPSGAFAVSDPVKFQIQPAQVITVSIYLHHGQTGGHVTGHPGSRTQIWMSHGDFTKEEDINDPSTKSTFHWYYVSGVEAWQPGQNRAMVLIGDSLTDGRSSTNNGNDRWPDLLFNLMVQHLYARNISVLNQAAGGNRILKDEKVSNVLSRLDRDIFAQPGVKYVMIFEGVNDIGTAGSDAESQKLIGDMLIKAYKQIISRVYAFGIPIFASTIAPFMASDATIQPYAILMMEQTRQRINALIRESGAFDAVIDFDFVLRDPNNITHLNPDFNSGDYLHSNVKAYHAMARAFRVGIFEEFSEGVQTFD